LARFHGGFRAAGGCFPAGIGQMTGMAADDPNQAPGNGEDPRLSSLEERLKQAHRDEGRLTSPKDVGSAFTGKGASQGNRVLSVLMGAPLGGLIVGYALDQFLGTRPKAMLALLFLGIVAGFWQVIRISRERAE
jgi:ATP synthase protein I